MNITMIDNVGIDTMFDPITARYFKCTEREFIRHVEVFNRLRAMYNKEEIDLNTWFDIIGLPRITIGECFEWRSFKDIGILDIRYYEDVRGDLVVGIIVYDVAPIFVMSKYKN